MTREEIIRNLKYTMEKHRNDYVPTFGTNIFVMCQDILNYLEGEPCADAVSRQEALNLFNNSDEYGWEMSLLKKKIKDLPPVKPIACIAEISFSKEDMQELVDEKIKEITAELEERKWTPVKEHLPETDGEYLLFGRTDESEEYYKFIGTFDAGAEEFGIWQECFDYNTLGCIGSEFYEYDEVLAWMPLPDDYKEGVEE